MEPWQPHELFSQIRSERLTVSHAGDDLAQMEQTRLLQDFRAGIGPWRSCLGHCE
jgi:hypothetical protein